MPESSKLKKLAEENPRLVYGLLYPQPILKERQTMPQDPTQSSPSTISDEEASHQLAVILDDLSTSDQEGMRAAIIEHVPFERRILMVKMMLDPKQVELIRWALQTTLATQPSNAGTEAIKAMLAIW